MKRKLIATLLVLGLMLTFAPITIFSTSAADNTWNNDGNTDLYVTTKEDLRSFAQAIANGATFSGRTVHIMADIDMGARDVDPSAGGGPTDWPLNLSTGTSFSGMIDGHGHTVQGINVSHGTGGTNKGLFGNTLTPIEGFTVGVKNLTIKNSFVRGTNAGGLFGQIADQAGEVVLDNLDLDIIVYANGTYAGGMFAQSRGYDVTVSNCIFRGSVEAKTSTAGGFFGFQLDKKLTIANSVVSGKVTSGGVNVGGFIAHVRENGAGSGSNTQILGCVFDGTVTVKVNNAHAGGFVGRVGATGSGTVTARPGNLTIRDCAFYGTVESTYTQVSHIGGLVGATNGSCKSTVTLDRCVIAGTMSQPEGLSANDGWYVRMTIAAVSSTGTATINNIVGNVKGNMASTAYNPETSAAGVYISTKPFKSSNGATLNWGSTFLTGWSGLIPNGYKEAKFYYSNGTGALGLDLSDTFVATTSTKPLPMGTVKFYASQMDAIGDGCATGVIGKQTKTEADGTIALRLIGLLKADAEGKAPAYEAVGLEVVVIRANGASVKSINNASHAATTEVYTSLEADNQVKTAADLDARYKYIFTGTYNEIDPNGGELVFVVRSFHEVDGVRNYDDTRVIVYDPAVVA